MATGKLKAPSSGVQIYDASSGIVSIDSAYNSILSISRASFTVRNRHVSGYFVIRVLQSFSTSNSPIAYISSDFTPLISSYYPAFVNPSEWGTSSDEAKTGYLNTNRQFIINWNKTITTNKYIVFCLNYDF